MVVAALGFFTEISDRFESQEIPGIIELERALSHFKMALADAKTGSEP
jgi:hypothetical protein